MDRILRPVRRKSAAYWPAIIQANTDILVEYLENGQLASLAAKSHLANLRSYSPEATATFAGRSLVPPLASAVRHLMSVTCQEVGVVVLRFSGLVVRCSATVCCSRWLVCYVAYRPGREQTLPLPCATCNTRPQPAPAVER
jgi:hypothetical protein